MLEGGHGIFPFLLTRQGGEARHSAIPVEIDRSFYDHKEKIRESVNFHFKDTYLADSVANLLPAAFWAMESLVFGYQFRFIDELESLAEPFCWESELFNAV